MGRIKSYLRKRAWAKYQKSHGIVKSKHRNGGSFLVKLGIGFIAALVILPLVGDIINGYVKEAEGCRVWQVVDGDTVRIQCSDGSHPARILAYDTPELKARCPSELFKAVAATYYLRWQLWKARTISTKIDGVDRYQRKLVVLLVDGEGIAQRMVDAKLARWYDGGRRASWCAAPR